MKQGLKRPGRVPPSGPRRA